MKDQTKTPNQTGTMGQPDQTQDPMHKQGQGQGSGYQQGGQGATDWQKNQPGQGSGYQQGGETWKPDQDKSKDQGRQER